MSTPDEQAESVETLLQTPELARALDSEPFRRFLDQIPIAIVVAQTGEPERIAYANPDFERLTGHASSEIVGEPWSALRGSELGVTPGRTLGEAIIHGSDFVGAFEIEQAGQEATIVDVYSNVIQDEDARPVYRLAALVRVALLGAEERVELEQRIRDKDALLWEVQHRVKNNLQLITALLRIEAKNVKGQAGTEPFNRLAGRIAAIQTLYALLSDHGQGAEVDLGVYLSKIASSVMETHAVEGIRLDLKVDAYPVSVNVAMPTGLVVNELLTNALKHAFVGRDGGTIMLHSLSEDGGCRVVVADDGVGLPDGMEWPKRGKLGSAIVQSLRENAKARLEVVSTPGEGMRVEIHFSRGAAAPQPVN